MKKLTEESKQLIVELVERRMRGRCDQVLVIRDDETMCFETVKDNPYVDAVPQVMKHYECSWKPAEDIVCRVLGIIRDIERADKAVKQNEAEQ